VTLVNERTHDTVAAHVEMALSSADRRRGLLGRSSLDADAAMLLSPCMGVHTVGMPFPIDVVFVDRSGCAVRVVHELRPWRMAVSLRASSVIELSPGRLKTCPVEIGDRLRLVVADPESSAHA
jgi:uncharacterized membrane protein (UPF0127 family)